MDTFHLIEITVTYFIQNLGTWLLPIMGFFSFCATEEFFILVMPILFWCIDAAIGMRVGVVVLMSSSLVEITKMAFQLGRPYWIFPKVRTYALESSFGLPSGHAQKAVAVWATLASSFRKNWLWILSIFVIFMISLSRIFLGVHFLSDVLTGLAISILFLFLYLKLEAPVTRWAKKRPMWVITLVSLIVSVVPVLIAAAIRAANAGWQIPAGWLVTNIDPFNPEGTLTLNGTLFGLLIGYVWLVRSGGFKTGGTPGQLVLRYFLGIAGIFAIRYGLKFIFPETLDFLGFTLRFIRYGLIGLWVSALAPFAFIKLGLSEKA